MEYGFLAFLLLAAVIGGCTVGKASIKRYLRKMNRSGNRSYRRNDGC